MLQCYILQDNVFQNHIKMSNKLIKYFDQNEQFWSSFWDSRWIPKQYIRGYVPILCTIARVRIPCPTRLSHPSRPLTSQINDWDGPNTFFLKRRRFGSTHVRLISTVDLRDQRPREVGHAGRTGDLRAHCKADFFPGSGCSSGITCSKVTRVTR